MNEYDGMAFIKLYINRACTKEIEKDVNGDYILDKNKVSNNAHNPMTFTFYAKNVGSHKAYDYKIIKASGSTLEYSIVTNKTNLASSEQARVMLIATIPSGNTNKNMNVRVEYDNV